MITNKNRKSWQTKKLGEVVKLEKKQNGKKKLPYVGMEDIESNTAKFLGELEPRNVKSTSFHFTKEHVLYGRLRPYLNKVLLPSFEGHCSTEIFPMKIESDLEKKYLFYWITYDETVKKINATCTGARMPRANIKDVLEFEIPLPPLPEQKRIVKILDEVFEKIGKVKENAQKNLQNFKEVFESYLHNIFTHKNNNWETKKLSEVCEKITDGTHQTPKYFDEGFIFLSSRNVTSGKINWEKIKYIDHKQHIEMHKRVAPRREDILLAKNGTTGVAAMVDKDVVFDIYVSLALLRTKGEVIPSFLLYFINSPVAKKQFNKRLKGSGVANLHLEEIREVVITFSKSLAEQKSIVKKLDALSAETKKLEAIYTKKLANLEELKKSVLKKAFAGEL